jgi:hypothetical protein
VSSMLTDRRLPGELCCFESILVGAKDLSREVQARVWGNLVSDLL